MTKTLSATKARQEFFKLLNDAGQPGSCVTITLNGKPKVVMVPFSDFEDWMKTLKIMSSKKT